MAWITTSHCLDVPDAMLVRHHAASNWSLDSGWPSIVTNDGTRPALMQSSIGGDLASFQKIQVAEINTISL